MAEADDERQEGWLRYAAMQFGQGLVVAELTPHVATLFAAIDAQAAKDPTAFDKLRVAASHMPMTANVLAGGIAKQFPQKFGS